MIKKYIKQFWYYFRLWDGLWSFPLACLLFILSGVFGFMYFGDEIIATDRLQIFVLSMAELIGLNFIVFLGNYFNFRSLQKYFYSKEIKVDVSNNLTTWQRITLYLFSYFGLALLFIILYIVNLLTLA
jgi:hypothetical protein